MDGAEGNDKYHIYVYSGTAKVNLVEYEGGDNGYYGTGYSLYVSLAKSKKEESSNGKQEG